MFARANAVTALATQAACRAQYYRVGETLGKLEAGGRSAPRYGQATPSAGRHHALTRAQDRSRRKARARRPDSSCRLRAPSICRARDGDARAELAWSRRPGVARDWLRPHEFATRRGWCWCRPRPVRPAGRRRRFPRCAAATSAPSCLPGRSLQHVIVGATTIGGGPLSGARHDSAAAIRRGHPGSNGFTRETRNPILHRAGFRRAPVQVRTWRRSAGAARGLRRRLVRQRWRFRASLPRGRDSEGYVLRVPISYRSAPNRSRGHLARGGKSRICRARRGQTVTRCTLHSCVAA